MRAVTRGIRQDLLQKSLRRHARFKQGVPKDALLGMSTADGGLPESEVPSLPDDQILRAVRTDALRGGYYLADYRGYRGYEPGENVVHLFVMGALVKEAAAASALLLEKGLYANVIVVTSPELLLGILGEHDDYRHLREGLEIRGDLHLGSSPLGAADAIDLAGRRIPIVAVQDGEAGLLDNIGSIVGTRQRTLAIRKFSKSGTPAQIYEYHHIDPASIAGACEQVLAETATERVLLSGEALSRLRAQQSEATQPWRELV